MEVIALVGSDRHKACAHGEAVEVAAYIAIHVGNLVGVEVI